MSMIALNINVIVFYILWALHSQYVPYELGKNPIMFGNYILNVLSSCEQYGVNRR